MNIPLMKLWACLGVYCAWVASAAGDIDVGFDQILLSDAVRSSVGSYDSTASIAAQPFNYGFGTPEELMSVSVDSLLRTAYARDHLRSMMNGGQPYGFTLGIESALGGTILSFDGKQQEPLDRAFSAFVVGGPSLSVLPDNMYFRMYANQIAPPPRRLPLVDCPTRNLDFVPAPPQIVKSPRNKGPISGGHSRQHVSSSVRAGMAVAGAAALGAILSSYWVWRRKR